MKNPKPILVLFLAVACAGSFAPCAAQGVAQVPAASQAAVSVRFFDKRIYYPGDPIYVKITVSNESPRPFRFKLAENRMFSLFFDARTPSNRVLDRSDFYKRSLSSSEAVFYRDIALEPGEEYSFVENLADYIAIPGPGVYVVQCRFYPELARSAALTEVSVSISSNALSLDVRPGASSLVSAETALAASGEILKPERIPPDEVVRRTIVARQRSLWAEFFLYLDIQALLSADPEKKRIYDRESDDGRRRMLERYRVDLEQRIVDTDIVVIPDEFKILETRYADTSGSVRVLEKFQYEGFKMLKEYVYELRKRDDIWYIVAYTVVNKGTE